MLSLKHIGAYFLLFVYSLAFGHQILPHHHHEDSSDHNHCVTEKEAHNHVAHEDHFDEGLLDYLACVLGSHEHNSTKEYAVFELVRNQKNKGKTTQTVAEDELRVSVFNRDLTTSNPPIFYHSQHDFKTTLLANNKAKRGPPQV